MKVTVRSELEILGDTVHGSICSVTAGCERPVHLLGMCERCFDIYMQAWLGKHGRRVQDAILFGDYLTPPRREPDVKCWLRDPGVKS